MSGMPNGKLRILFIMRMLQEETDADKGLSMTSIIEHLAENNMSADRKTVYADLKLLREFGMDIGTAQRNPVEYYLANRDFKIDELMLMVDAVQSCRFMSQAQADRLSISLKLLAPDGQQEKLNRRIHVEGRARGRNDAVLKNVDAIHDAMHKGSRISYTYWKMGTDGKPHAQHNGEIYDVTPMRVSFDEGYYYLTAFSERDETVREYRVDRMRDVRANGQKARRGKGISDYKYEAHDSQFFGRFNGELLKATFTCDDFGVNIVADHFGKDATFIPKKDGTCTAIAQVRVSPQFFGWVAGMNGHVQIAKPKKLVNAYVDYLNTLVEKMG